MKNTYKVAALFDIHGNYPALRAVLDDAATYQPDCHVFGGDIVSGVGQPGLCMNAFKAVKARGVMGNTDEKVLKRACELTSWTRSQLQPEDVEILSSLPLRCRIQPPGATSPKDDLLIVHSTPRSCHDFLVLNPRKPGPGRSGQRTADAELRAMLSGEDFNTLLYGHIHYTSTRLFEGRSLMSVIPVGLPEDEDTRAGYALAEWKNGTWDITIKRVEYDYDSAADFVEASGQPYGRRFAAMIRQATYLPKSEKWK